MPVSPVYSAAKAGVVNFTRSLGYLADDCGVRVNAICPELVDTPLGAAMGGKVLTGSAMAKLRASKSVLSPEEVAEWVVRIIEDDRRAGAVLQLTKAEGGRYV
jgi:NAD(P)-dependent dehydrogenase (short-subunit alcohol dehydrogenase family)